VTCAFDHEELKHDEPRWSALPFVGLQQTYDRPGKPTHLELRNCACGSTLCKPVTKES
jgi:hypothetical protein